MRVFQLLLAVSHLQKKILFGTSSVKKIYFIFSQQEISTSVKTGDNGYRLRPRLVTVMAYFHCRTRIPVLFFHGSNSDSDP